MLAERNKEKRRERKKIPSNSNPYQNPKSKGFLKESCRHYSRTQKLKKKKENFQNFKFLRIQIFIKLEIKRIPRTRTITVSSQLLKN